MDLDALQPGFTYLRLERIDRAKNEQRYYELSWEPTLLDTGAVVRRYGRLGGQHHTLAPEPFSSLQEAWPYIRAIIRRRLRNGYRIVGPEHLLKSIDLSPQT